MFIKIVCPGKDNTRKNLKISQIFPAFSDGISQSCASSKAKYFLCLWPLLVAISHQSQGVVRAVRNPPGLRASPLGQFQCKKRLVTCA